MLEAPETTDDAAAETSEALADPVARIENDTMAVDDADDAPADKA